MSPPGRLDLTVELSTPSVSVKPGDQATVEVGILNLGSFPQRFHVTAVGLPSEDLWSADVDGIDLQPGERGAVSVRIQVPTDARGLGGDHVVGVLVRSLHHPDVSRSAELVVRIEGDAATNLSVQPDMVQHPSSGECAVTLQNHGASPQMLTVTAFDDQARARISVHPKQQWVPAGGTGDFRIAWTAPLFLAGQPKTSTITVEARAGQVKLGDAQVTFVQKPRLPASSLRTVAIAVGIVALAGAIIFGGLLIGGRQILLGVPAAQRTPPATGGPGSPNSPAQPNNPGQPNNPAPPNNPGDQPPTGPRLAVAPAMPRVGDKVAVTALTADPINSWSWQVSDRGNNIVATASTPGQFEWVPKEPGDYALTLAAASPTGPLAVTQPIKVAPPFHSTSTEDVGVPSGTSSHDVVCPGERKPVHGGVTMVQGNGNTSPNVGIVQSGPTASGWNVILNNPTGQTGRAEVSVLCIDPVPGMAVQRQQVDVKGKTTAQLQVACPADQVVLGGGAGYVAGEGEQLTGLVRESYPDRTSANGPWRYWSAVLEPKGSDVGQVWAVCGATPDHQVVVSRGDQRGNGQVDLILTCTRGSLVSAGAALDRQQQSPGTGAIQIRSSAPVISAAGELQGWRLSVDYRLPATRQLNSYAVCVQPD